jgi:hypothetical protein
VRLAPHEKWSDHEDLAAIEDFATLLVILLAQPDAENGNSADAQGWRG